MQCFCYTYIIMIITREAINRRFFLAVDALKDSKQMKNLEFFAKKYNVNRSFLNYARNHPEALLRPETIANFAQEYKISIEYLMFGKGGIFKQ